MPNSKLENGLDDIMEDLIVGHNFNYARKAILELVYQLEEVEHQEKRDKWKSICGCPMCDHHSTAYELTQRKSDE